MKERERTPILAGILSRERMGRGAPVEAGSEPQAGAEETEPVPTLEKRGAEDEVIGTLPPSCAVSCKSELLAAVLNDNGSRIARNCWIQVLRKVCGPRCREGGSPSGGEEFLPLPKAEGRAVKRSRGRTSKRFRLTGRPEALSARVRISGGALLFVRIRLERIRMMEQKSWDRIATRIEDIERRLVHYEPEISDGLRKMLISAEDHRFLLHRGVDYRALIRAGYRTLLGHREGGSTIAQQLVRVVENRFERSIRRKAWEIRMALRVTKTFSRESIPLVYLAVAYYGWRMNGLDQACIRLGYGRSDLTDEQAAGLVARLKYPEPRVAPEQRKMQIKRRATHILKLYDQHWLQEQLPGLHR